MSSMICAGREHYSPLGIVYENVVIFAQFGLAAWLLADWRLLGLPVVSIAFGLYCLVMVGYVGRRQLCSRCCYYGRWCHCGWGKLAALVVAKSTDPKPVDSKLAPMFWLSVMLLPLVSAGLALGLSRSSWSHEWPLLAVFAVTLVLSTAKHVHDCRTCKMRLVCPGSAAKCG